MERVILHSDLNSFYASVEIMLNPELQGKPVAVCGNTETRHGIVLAKSEPAKKAGVKTGMVNWEAKQLCPELICVSPHYEQYLKYSKLTRAIYQRYTDQVEPFGMDECWLDVTGSQSLFGTGREIAEEIRQATKEELGLSVSIGVSFNKVFAKLGSDMNKPDAVTEILPDNFKEKVWCLPVSELLYVGRATTRKLNKYGFYTIGDLANAPEDFIRKLLGVNGTMVQIFARGQDTSRVMHQDFCSPIKSIGHGITCTADLINDDEVWKVMLELSQDIGHRLRVHDLSARAIQITIRDNSLSFKQYQEQLPITTQSPMDIARAAHNLFIKEYEWKTHVRAVTVRAINLVPYTYPQQMNLLVSPKALQKRENLDTAIEKVRARYGKKAIYSACLMGDIKIPSLAVHDIIMPGMMYV